MEIEKRMKTAGVIACISAIVWAIPHFWFWGGISFAYPGDFENTSRTDALLFVGGFGVLAAIYAMVLTHSSWPKQLPEFIASSPAWVGAVGFMVWGIAYFGLQVHLTLENATSSEQYFASDTNPNAVWGLYWYPLFILWGLSLGTAAFYFHKLKKLPNRAAGKGLAEEG